MISRRLGGGDEAYYTYVEETDNDANEDSALIQKWGYFCFFLRNFSRNNTSFM